MTNYDIIKEYEAHKIPVPCYQEWQELKEASDGVSKLMFKSLMNRFVKADEERERLSEENQQLKELLKEYKKQLSEIKNAYIDLTTQDEYGSYYIDEAKLFVEMVGIIIKYNSELKIDNATGEKK